MTIQLERTLILFKPDAVERRLVGRILTEFEDAGYAMVGSKIVEMDDEFIRSHYFDLEERHGSEVYRVTAEFMGSGPIVAIVLEGVNAVDDIRDRIGSTYPDQAAIGTIRRKYAHVSKAWSIQIGASVQNLLHASATLEEAKVEIALWFKPDELLHPPQPSRSH